MLQRLAGVASDSRCPNSPQIDFNGEILISFWPRSASKGQIICWGNAGHSVPWSQSIILTGCTKEERWRVGGKTDLVKLQQIHPQPGRTNLQNRGEAGESRYLKLWLQLLWIQMLCLLSANARQITADGITVRVPGAENEDLWERVYILFTRFLAGAGERLR